MEQRSDKKKLHQPFPRYLIVIFAIILAIAGFGIGQFFYKPGTLSKALNPVDNEPLKYNIEIASIPVLKPNATQPKINAKNIILLDSGSKFLMFGQGAHDRTPIASITKLMTGIVTSENKKFNDIVTIEQSDIDVIGSKIGLETGEKVKVSELMKGMLIKSGNDCANALARTTGGSEKAFVELMNKKVAELGLKNTHYADPHGLSADGYSTAFDQATVLSYTLNISKIKEIISTSETIVTAETGEQHELKNSNRLITDELPYEGAIGGKTGFTLEAGHSLAVAAERDGHTLIAVVLNTSYSTNDASAIEASKLLDWGFANFDWL